MQPVVVLHQDIVEVLAVVAMDWGFSRHVAVTAAAWLGYSFLLSWMDEGFSRFLGKQGK